MIRLNRFLADWFPRLVAFAALAALPLPAKAADPADPIVNAFEYAQLASLSESAIGLNASLALASRASGDIPSLERERRVLTAALQAAERAFENALIDDDAAMRRQASDERARIIADIERVEATIKARDPAYWDLVHPEALSLAGVQALLAPDEALLFVVTFETRSYSFVVTKSGATWSRADGYGTEAVAADVNAVRAAIRDELDGISASDTDFDVTRAANIHATLIAPVASALVGKARLLVVTSGPLAALPLGMIPANDGGSDAAPGWLADRYIITALPSVSTLRAQRCLLVAGGQRHPGCVAAGAGSSPARAGRAPARGFLGIGNPDLGKPGARNTVAAPIAGDWISRGIANRDMLMSMASLPGTKAELEAGAQSFGLADSRLLMGNDATEPNVRQALPRSRPRIVSFATHGLLASQTGPLAEPGLVLTPPTSATQASDSDGFLAASEIAQLDFGSATVILSACNTGTEERALASRNLNSLARAFQYAGAGQVVASHWAVSDEATAKLMALFLAQLAADPSLPIDMALHRAQRELRQDRRWASPAYWAPFSIIGISR